MKNKKNLYFLLPLVLIVWGIIAYRLIVHFNNNKHTILPQSNETIDSNDLHTQDTFSLNLNYRDPFLGTTGYSENIDNTKTPFDAQNFFRAADAQQAATPIPWPTVTYHGIILNKKSGSRITLIKIDSKEQLLAEGQSVSGITLMKAYPDSGIFRYQKELKTIKK
jgi:type II secretory pathway component PulC